MKILLIAIYHIFCLFCVAECVAQIHAHNDYEKPYPFHNAYKNGAQSIEVDIFLKDGELLVAHDTSQFDQTRTLTALYLNPINSLIETSVLRPMQLMIDIKSEAIPTLAALLKILEQFPLLTNNKNLKIVISGNRPEPEQFKDYPKYILFDGLLNIDYPEATLQRVPMFSDNYKNYTDTTELKKAIKKAHQLHKTIRFWNAPDNLDAWKQLKRLNADWLNTDNVEACAAFLRSLNTLGSARDSLSN